jgi:hypothetical protein
MLRIRLSALSRLIAAASLLALAASSSESLVGELRDGEVHHESVASAASHHDGMGLRSDHGHEDGGTTRHRHGSKHQHGTTADHCTHAHGQGVTATFAWDCQAFTTVVEFPDPGTSISFVSTVPFGPPRA